MNDELVSVAVISYNSEKTIVETLDSIKGQTYQNIELIVSDDCSQDKTVEIAENWIVVNRERFARVVLLTIDQNTGISANANRAFRSCQGEWMKVIAADDILLPYCIEVCIKYITMHPEINWLSGRTKKYFEFIDNSHLLDDNTYTTETLRGLNGSLEIQKEIIVNLNFIDAPAVFIRTQILNEIGGYDERYKFLDDWPAWYKLIFLGEKCFFLDEYIVGYRANENSVSLSTDKLFNFSFKQSEFLFIRNELFKYHSLSYNANKTLHYWLCTCFEWLKINNTRFFNKKLYAFFFRLIDILT